MTLTVNVDCVPEAVAPDRERELIAQAQRHPAALAALYRLHHRAIATYVARRVGRHADVDDLVAETFLAMVRYLPRYRWTGAPFRAWLYRLATNEVNRWAKRRRRWAVEQLRCETAGRDDMDRSTSHDVERLRLALLTLSPRHQAVLSLYYLEEMPIADVAQALGCRIGTVKSRLARGREALRRLLEDKERDHA